MKVQNALQLVVSNEWSQWALKKKKHRDMKAKVESLIIGIAGFFLNVEKMVVVLESIVVMFQFTVSFI